MKDINSYLSKYWAKYPHEQENDPSYSNIINWIKSGGKYYLKENILILYEEDENCVDILFYWCDMQDIPLNKVKKTLKNHKEFIKKFKKDVYSYDVKELFKRDYLVAEENKRWRWL